MLAALVHARASGASACETPTAATAVTGSAMASTAQQTPGAFCQHRLLRRAPFLCAHTRPSRTPAGLSKQRSLRHLPSSLLTRAVSPDALNRALCDGSDWEQPAEGFNSIPEALSELAEGKFVVVLDDESRENEGDLIMAAETMTTEAMAFMVEYTSGVICVPAEGRYADFLELHKFTA